jgi:hypothetical protein
MKEWVKTMIGVIKYGDGFKQRLEWIIGMTLDAMGIKHKIGKK